MPAQTAEPQAVATRARRSLAREVWPHGTAEACVLLEVAPKTVLQLVKRGYVRTVSTPAGEALDQDDLIDLKRRYDATHGLRTHGQVAALLGIETWVLERLVERTKLCPTVGRRNWRYYTDAELAVLREGLAQRNLDTQGLIDVRTAAGVIGMSHFTLLDYAQRGILPAAWRNRYRTPYFDPKAVADLVARRAAARAVPEGYVRQSGAYQRLGVTRQRLSQLVRAGHLHPVVGLDGHRRFKIAELDAYRAMFPRPAA